MSVVFFFFTNSFVIISSQMVAGGSEGDACFALVQTSRLVVPGVTSASLAEATQIQQNVGFQPVTQQAWRVAAMVGVPATITVKERFRAFHHA